MEKVIAVVVTYNRQELLAGCITALRNQTRAVDAILVINNGSTDHTAAWLKEQENIIVINQQNTGSAGGFSTGIKWAYDHGYTWIWCMDDDGYSREDALENLLDAEDGTLRLLNCAVLNNMDKSSIVWKTKTFLTGAALKDTNVDGVAHPFNGTLIHRRIVERAGVPDPKYFLWGDETEYLYRITRKNNIPARTVGNAVHFHPASRFSVKGDWDHFTCWKMYFYVRNRYPVLQAKANNKLLGLARFFFFLAAFAGIILFFQRTNRLRKLRFMLWPAKDALGNKYTATPAGIIKKLQVNRPAASQLNEVTNSVQQFFTASSRHKAAGV